MIKNLLPIFFLLLGYASVLAQNTKPPKVVFGGVSEEDLTMTVYEKDSSADAVVLYDYQRIANYKPARLVDQFTYYRHVRIKILKRSAFDLASIEIPIYKDFRTSIKSIEAHTITIENGKVIKTPIKKKEIFEEKITNRLGLKKFTFPNLKEGAIIEYKCIYTDEYTYVLNHKFQRKIPVRWSEVEIIIPRRMQYIMDLNIKDVSFDIKNRTDFDLRGNAEIIPGERFHFAMKYLKALKEEPYIRDIEDYRINLTSYKISKASGDWAIVNTKYFNLQNYYIRDVYGLKNSFKRTKQIVSSSAPEMDKMLDLYKFISKNIKWNGDYNIQPSAKTLDGVLKKEEGNSADINMLFMALLKKANIKVFPILIRTRDKGNVAKELPFIYQFNHMILQIQIDGKDYFVDAIHDNYPYDILEFNSMTGEGYRVDNLYMGWTKVTTTASKSVFDVKMKIDTNGVVNGTYNIILEGNPAIEFRQKLEEHQEAGNTNASIYEEDDETFSENEITNYELDNLNEIDKRLQIKFDIESSNFTESTTDLIYFSPVWLTQFKENPFWAEERKYPVDLGYKIEELYLLKLKIPEGYEVESLPKGAKLDLLGKAGQFMFVVEQKENSINITSRLKLNEPVIQAEYYTYLKQFFELIAEKQNEQIVLKKLH